jgi:hypothetical protein
MKIHGVSQTSGVERELSIEKGIKGVVLIIVDHKGRKEQGRVSVLADTLTGAIVDAPPNGVTLDGLPSPNLAPGQMTVEVRRNEVWLTITSDVGLKSDIAVGFDDLQDALEGVISRV